MMDSILDEAGREAVSSIGGLDSNKGSMNLMASKDDHLFFWSQSHQGILAIRLGSPQTIQRFMLTDIPMFEVRKLEVSPMGRWFSLSGPKGLSIVALPSRFGKGGALGGGKSEIILKTMPIAERFFLCQSKLIIQQVGWHPGSPGESHVLVLSSDNCIRIYDLDRNDDEALQQPVRSISLHKAPLFGQSFYSVKSSLGETVVGFSFAPPTNGSTTIDQEWPAFVILENGSVYCIVANILDYKKPHCVMGPIPIKHEFTEDFCSILCLHPMIASPPVIVLATTKGTLYHCVVLHEDCEEGASNDDDVLSQISEWSASVVSAMDPQFSLHVFESVELELGLTTKIQDKDTDERPFEYPIALYVDPTSPGRYFCAHEAGVHCVGVPMIFQLVKMASQPEGEDFDILNDGLPSVRADCMVEHLICTRMGQNCPQSPVLGLSIVYPPTRLLCLLSSFQLEVLPLSSPQIEAPLPLYLNHGKTNSPIKKYGGEPFDQRIKKLLQKPNNHPLIKSGKDTELKPKECLDVLMRSTQVMREEYLTRLETVRREIEHRASSLARQKVDQKISILKLETDRKVLTENASRLAERYEDLKDNGNRLISRIYVVLQNIQSQLPIASDTELRMKKELVDVEKKIIDLKLNLKQVQTKEKYQLKQIRNAHINNNQQWRSYSSDLNEFDEEQIESLKDILYQDSLHMSDIVKSINTIKKELSLL